MTMFGLNALTVAAGLKIADQGESTFILDRSNRYRQDAVSQGNLKALSQGA